MLLQVQPLFDAIEKNHLEDTHVIFPSPKGPRLDQNKLEQLATMGEIALVAGRYEGIDQRFIDTYVDEQISLGDFIITGGELAIQVILDGVIRLKPGVLKNEVSAKLDSFSDGLLEHPQYTRPSNFRGLEVPEVLLNGNHKLQEEWMFEQKILETKKYRPDLLENLDKELQKKVDKILEKNK